MDSSSLLETRIVFFSISLGPTSTLNGTPFCSHSLNLKPGETSDLSSIITLNSLRVSFNWLTTVITESLSLSFGIIGTMTIWWGANLGGSFKPLSSPWAMIIIPTNLVLTPQLVWYGCCNSLFSSENVISNAFEKFCPNSWEVPAWSAFMSFIIASIEYVVVAPANFSISDFVPLITDTAAACFANSSYISNIFNASSLASSIVAWAVCPSCHRNSDVLKNSLVLISHLTTFDHWLISIGRSLWLDIHFANIWFIIVSEVGLTINGSSNSLPPACVTVANSGEKPSTCSASFSINDLGINIGKYAFLWPVSLNLLSK